MPNIAALHTAVSANSAAVTNAQKAIVAYQSMPDQQLIDELTKIILANTEVLKSLQGPPNVPLTPLVPAPKSSFFGS